VCGIAVILPGSEIEPPPSAIERMTEALVHRGPDERVCLRLPGCQLGHTRLSVIDPAKGRQPMTDSTGRFTVVFNGEIYNHADLRRELEREAGVHFCTRCDTEVLLHGFARWGAGVLSRLNGQFAFAVWDATSRTLFAARDRFGEKPLYWARTSAGHLLLASEIKAILASGLLRPRLDVTSVDAYLGLYYVPPDRSIYENIHPLPPAHAAEWDAGGESRRRPWRYWEPRYSSNDVDEHEAVRHVRTLVERAVARQTVADVPVGAFLSGGLDSTTIVALLSRHSAQSVRTFSVGFGDLIDELPFARDVAAAYATDHHEMEMNIDVAAMLEQMNGVYDEPFGDSSNIPTFLVAEYARREVKVVLSGDGGDEIFGGYDWYRPLLDGAEASGGIDVWERHVNGATALCAERSALWGSHSQPPAAAAARECYLPSDDVRALDRATAFDVACYLPGDILTKVDRAAMAHGLETRSPFLDVELAEFVLGLPWPLRFASPRAGEGEAPARLNSPKSAEPRAAARGDARPPIGHDRRLKHLLRQSCGELWPASIRCRGKQGFGAPIRQWLQEPAVDALWRRVVLPSSPLAALLPGARSPDLLDSLRPQRKWTLLCLGLWLERRAHCLASLS
jgi:asparagine synthase (glutamine-hydrolysing)